MSARVYVLSYHNPERASRMKMRLDTIGLPYEFGIPVEKTDSRIPQDISESIKRICSCTLGHLYMIRKFSHDDDAPPYGIFCEDDIHIRRDLADLLPILTGAYESYKLNLMLLGYLIAKPPVNNIPAKHFMCTEPQLSFLQYHDQVWGTQMYMISKSRTREILDMFGGDYIIKSMEHGSPIAADWTITKFGTRALVYPMMAVEEGSIMSDDPNHAMFHSICHTVNYDVNLHI
jgi:hypothetical protein